jgi:hypothetical protein
VLLTVLAHFALPQHRGARLFFALCCIGLLLFPWLTGLKGIRYTGPLVIAWISAQWIGWGSTTGKIQRWSVGALLLLQLTGWATMLTVEVRRPFSQGTALAEAIEGIPGDPLPVVETRYTAGPVISALLDRPLLYPTMGGTGSWCVWSRDPFMVEEEAIRHAPSLTGGASFILLTSGPVNTTHLPGWHNGSIACANGGMIVHEDGCATLVRPNERP